MTELTEKWKQGELKAGYYYVKNEFGNIFPSDYSEEYDSINDVVVKDFWTEVSEIIEVIAPVPSYKEWQEIKEFADYSLHNRYELTRQINFWMDKHTQIENKNQKLKELLLKAKGVIAAYRLTGSISFYSNEDEECITQIEQALGEE